MDLYRKLALFTSYIAADTKNNCIGLFSKIEPKLILFASIPLFMSKCPI